MAWELLVASVFEPQVFEPLSGADLGFGLPFVLRKRLRRGSPRLLELRFKLRFELATFASEFGAFHRKFNFGAPKFFFPFELDVLQFLSLQADQFVGVQHLSNGSGTNSDAFAGIGLLMNDRLQLGNFLVASVDFRLGGMDQVFDL